MDKREILERLQGRSRYAFKLKRSKEGFWYLTAKSKAGEVEASIDAWGGFCVWNLPTGPEPGKLHQPNGEEKALELMEGFCERLGMQPRII